MADSSPDTRNRRQPGSPGEPPDGSASMAPRSGAAPSEPRATSRSSVNHLDALADRPARLQMIVALTLGLVLVAIPLYLWRRPRAESIGPSGSAEAGAAIASPASAPSAEAVDAKPILGDPRNVVCQNPGGKKTPVDQCDHLPEVERALASAITEAARCMPKEAGGGTVTYVADVSFKRKTIHVGTPKEGRSVKNPKVVAACQAAVRARLQTLAFDPIVHAHSRYKIAITATYPGGT